MSALLILHNDNHYVQLFKVAKDLFDQQNVPTDIRIVINEIKRPTGEHLRRYSNSLSNELGVLMPNKNINNRDIVLHYRDVVCIVFHLCIDIFFTSTKTKSRLFP